ncbi:uncharacterized protein C8Q71DRAFT_735505 [Rhodofomes roseus]|uniref:Uncharacterized protein n=1 Tax=Rhodofomes roseus TaxID=34475 RepID=A0ABQ8KVI1_9APHY|nr:uncharacterized protein C8Q71DRAFT_735505 [Rhodofomes roseus]KAH9842999.1 hypothetical protein C8Q71DRAFT_735505 [Rhodofomes roseus]
MRPRPCSLVLSSPSRSGVLPLLSHSRVLPSRSSPSGPSRTGSKAGSAPHNTRKCPVRRHGRQTHATRTRLSASERRAWVETRLREQTGRHSLLSPRARLTFEQQQDLVSRLSRAAAGSVGSTQTPRTTSMVLATKVCVTCRVKQLSLVSRLAPYVVMDLPHHVNVDSIHPTHQQARISCSRATPRELLGTLGKLSQYSTMPLHPFCGLFFPCKCLTSHAQKS